MKARYKIGTFVKVGETEDAAASYGAIEEVRLTLEGVTYKVTNLDDAVSESEIVAAYREVKPRASKPRNAKPRTRKSKAAEAEATAA